LMTDVEQGQIILLTFAVAFLYKWWILLQWSLIRITQNANIAGPPVGAGVPPPVIIVEKVQVEPLLQEKSSSVIESTCPYEVPLPSPPNPQDLRFPLTRASPPIEPHPASARPAAPPVEGDNIKLPHLAGAVEEQDFELDAINAAFDWILDAGGFRGFKPLCRNLALVTLKFARLMLITIVLPHAMGAPSLPSKRKRNGYWLLSALSAGSPPPFSLWCFHRIRLPSKPNTRPFSLYLQIIRNQQIGHCLKCLNNLFVSRPFSRSVCALVLGLNSSPVRLSTFP
ncbi:hypothetical protein BT69DRAFT_1275337, partial [Atractiella rhizophila]